MDYENAIDEPEKEIDTKSEADITLSMCDDIPRTSNSYKLYEIDKEIGHFKAKLMECRKESVSTETEILNVNQLQDKGLFILKDMQRKYKQIQEEMDEIDCEYLKCVNNVRRYEETVYQKVNSLALKRDNLKTELANLNKVANENKKKLMDIRKMIEIQEKKNIALLRKLKKTEERTNIPQDLKEKVNEVLSGLSGTKINISN